MRKFYTVLALGLTSALISSCGETRESPSASSELDSGGSGGECLATVDWVYPNVSSLNNHVYGQSRASLGRQIGNGECATLADTYIRSGNGVAFSRLGPTGADADYVWGTLVSTITSQSKVARGAVPGDVIQFRNANFRWTYPNGSWRTASAAHHTAVVAAVSRDGGKVCVLHQNVGGVRKVQYGYYDLAGMQSGWMKVYRPRTN